MNTNAANVKRWDCISLKSGLAAAYIAAGIGAGCAETLSQSIAGALGLAPAGGTRAV